MQIQIDWNQEVVDPALSSFLPDFQKKRNAELLTLKRDLENGDFDALARLAHNWKGFSRPYGYIALEGLAKALETAAKAKDTTSCQQLLSEIAAYLKEKESRL